MKKLLKIKVWLPILLVGIGLIVVTSTQQMARKEVTSYRYEIPRGAEGERKTPPEGERRVRPPVGERKGGVPPPQTPRAPSIEINASSLGVIATILGTILGILRAIIEVIKLFKRSPTAPAGT
jgi:hypothetical protein